MNIVRRLALASSVALLISVSAHAHEASEHMKDAQSPDCAAMAEMDHDKMDMNDPVMAAMMKQCMTGSEHGEVAAGAAAHAEHGDAAASIEGHGEHSHELTTPVTAAVAEQAHQH